MVKINSLTIENTKRIRAVELTPAADGLTVIGGNNGQGKTSVLDSIAWALGGNRFAPSNPVRDGSYAPPLLHVELSNGLVVDRKGKNSALKVTDPSGKKAGQMLLDSFIGDFALNLPKFLEASDSEKAEALLQIIGIGDELAALDAQKTKLYNDRYLVGREADQKAKYAEELPSFPNVPEETVSASELIQQQQAILLKNEENRKNRNRAAELTKQMQDEEYELAKLETELFKRRDALEELAKMAKAASKTAEDLHDESTTELEANLNDIEVLNEKIRSNQNRKRAMGEAGALKDKYDNLTAQLNEVRDARLALLQGANLPLPELSISEKGALTYKGQEWDCMSSSEQLRVGTSIVRRTAPECGFILLDKLEQMDVDTLKEFGKWLETEGLQAIATRVSTGDECSIIIEDGYVKNTTDAPAQVGAQKSWKAGEF